MGPAAPPPYSVHTFPPHIPLPGLTCQLSLGPLGPALPPNANSQPAAPNPTPDQPVHARSLREQQVQRLRQEIGHPAGVRLVLRKRDCQHSLALIELFGCVWVVGWKQKEFPVLYNAFHVGDQIVSAGGTTIRTVSEFHKAVKVQQSQQQLHIEIIIRRLPFAQVFHLRREVDGQPLGIVLNGASSEIRDIVPASPASQWGMTSKVRSLDGQGLVRYSIF